MLLYQNHVVAGSKILAADSRRFAEEHHGTFNPVDALVGPMFFQIMLVFSMFRQPHRLVSSFDPRTMETVSMPVIPETFLNLHEAQQLFSRIIWWRYYLVLNGDQAWSVSSPSFQTIRSFLVDWQTTYTKYVQTIPKDDTKQLEMATAVLDQAQPLTGAVEYSVRDDVLDSLDCYPAAVELRSGAKASIWVQIAKNRKINLNGINQRRSNDGNTEVWLWPRAK